MDGTAGLKRVAWFNGLRVDAQHFRWLEDWAERVAAEIWVQEGRCGLLSRSPRALLGEAGAGNGEGAVQLVRLATANGRSLRVCVEPLSGILPNGERLDLVAGLEESVDAGSRDDVVLYVRGQWEEPEKVTASDDPDSHMEQDSHGVQRVHLEIEAGDDRLPVGRLRRTDAGWEVDGGFLPPCTTLFAHALLFRRAFDLFQRISEFEEQLRMHKRMIFERFSSDHEIVRAQEVLTCLGQRFSEACGGLADPSTSPVSFLVRVGCVLEAAERDFDAIYAQHRSASPSHAPWTRDFELRTEAARSGLASAFAEPFERLEALSKALGKKLGVVLQQSTDLDLRREEISFVEREWQRDEQVVVCVPLVRPIANQVPERGRLYVELPGAFDVEDPPPGDHGGDRLRLAILVSGELVNPIDLEYPLDESGKNDLQYLRPTSDGWLGFDFLPDEELSRADQLFFYLPRRIDPDQIQSMRVVSKRGTAWEEKVDGGYE